jgi:hypothetical protein
LELIKAKELSPGKVYRVWHARKGEFVCRLLEVLPADKGDSSDEELLHVIYDVRVGTDQAHLSVELGKQQYRESNIRPSLIKRIEELEGSNWLRDVQLPKVTEIVPVKQSGLERVLGFFRKK